MRNPFGGPQDLTLLTRPPSAFLDRRVADDGEHAGGPFRSAD